MVGALSGTALLAASVLTRFGIFYGGVASARDPRYTVVPYNANGSKPAEPAWIFHLIGGGPAHGVIECPVEAFRAGRCPSRSSKPEWSGTRARRVRFPSVSAKPLAGDDAIGDGPVDPRRRVPRTDTLLADPVLAAATATLGREQVKVVVSRAQDRARRGELNPDEVRDAAVAALPTPGPRMVLNATGVVLHTNLGRAPLSSAAVAAVVAAAGHTDVELDNTHALCPISSSEERS